MINCSFYSASFVPTVDDIRSLESLNKFLLYKLTNGISLFMKGVLLMLNVKHNHSWLYRKWLAIKRWCFVFVWFIIAIWYLNCDRLKLTLHSSNSEIVHYEKIWIVDELSFLLSIQMQIVLLSEEFLNPLTQFCSNWNAHLWFRCAIMLWLSVFLKYSGIILLYTTLSSVVGKMSKWTSIFMSFKIMLIYKL